MAGTPEIGSPATVAIDGEQIRVEVCGIDELYGIRVTNRHWGGKVGQWVQANELTAAN